MQTVYGSGTHGPTHYPRNTFLGSTKTNTLNGGYQTMCTRLNGSIKPIPINFATLSYQYIETNTCLVNTKI